jgi:hypothetical protein
MRKINVADITLKKLSGEREVSLLFREKTAIAVCADTIGTQAVELPPVKSAREDRIIYKTIAQNVQNASLAIPLTPLKSKSPEYDSLQSIAHPSTKVTPEIVVLSYNAELQP